MRVLCSKCSEVLASGLRPTKAERAYSSENCPSYSYYKLWMKRGVFFLTKAERYSWTSEDSGIEGYHRVIKNPACLVVSDQSLEKGVIRGDTNRCGCCNFSMGYPLTCPSCDTYLGGLYLDCYEMGEVMFDLKKVRRCYKSDT